MNGEQMKKKDKSDNSRMLCHFSGKYPLPNIPNIPDMPNAPNIPTYPYTQYPAQHTITYSLPHRTPTH